MIVIEIPPNPNCEAVEMRVFHDLDPPRAVTHVRLARDQKTVRWCDVIGWTTTGATCPARAQKVDDSGDGVAFLLHGGDAGLRFRPADYSQPWGLHQQEQWGLPFILTTDADDLRFADPAKKT